jgi:hypothetical protein
MIDLAFRNKVMQDFGKTRPATHAAGHKDLETALPVVMSCDKTKIIKGG